MNSDSPTHMSSYFIHHGQLELPSEQTGHFFQKLLITEVKAKFACMILHLHITALFHGSFGLHAP